MRSVACVLVEPAVPVQPASAATRASLIITTVADLADRSAGKWLGSPHRNLAKAGLCGVARRVLLPLFIKNRTRLAFLLLGTKLDRLRCLRRVGLLAGRHRLRGTIERRRQGGRLRLQERSGTDVPAPDVQAERSAEEGLARYGYLERPVSRGRRQSRDGVGRHVLADLARLAQRALARRRRQVTAREVRPSVQQRGWLRHVSRRVLRRRFKSEVGHVLWLCGSGCEVAVAKLPKRRRDAR